MIDKAKFAEKAALIILESGLRGDFDMSDVGECAADAWLLADAMQAEADKRKVVGVPEVLEFKIDWSLAPDGSNWWAMDIEGSCYWYFDKPRVKFDQTFSAQGVITGAPSFNYKGDWRDSLRGRPL